MKLKSTLGKFKNIRGKLNGTDVLLKSTQGK